MKNYLKSGSPSEDAIQKAFFQWVFLQEKFYPALKYFHHIPNGGSRNLYEALKLKSMGTRRGIPDTFLPVKSNVFKVTKENEFHGLYIEFKSEGGKRSKEQLATMDFLRTQKFYCHTCYSAVEAIGITQWYLGIKITCY